MALNDLRIVRTNGGLAKPLPSNDYISGLICYVPNTYFGTSELKYVFSSIEEAEGVDFKADSTIAGNDVIFYHIAEFFRTSNGGKLYVSIVPVTSGAVHTYDDIIDLQSFANGEIHQFGIYDPDLLDNSTSLQTAISQVQYRLNVLETNNMPAVAIYAPKVFSSELVNLPVLNATNLSPKVAVLIGGDGAGYGNALRNKYGLSGISITCVGACLGAIAKAKVSESIAWVEKQNVVSSTYPTRTIAELDVPAFSDGTIVSSLLPSVLTTLNDKGYIFLRKHVSIAGTYFNDEFTVDVATSDYNTLHANRTMDKASRGLRAALLPKLSGPVEVTATGTIKIEFIEYLKTIGSEPLQAMLEAKEISAFLFDIDPNQAIISTSTLNVIARVVPIGVANDIVVSLGFAVSIA
jgi:hypothetical protein